MSEKEINDDKIAICFEVVCISNELRHKRYRE